MQAEPVLVRDHIDDMEFIPFDGNGKIIKDSAGDYPAPEKIGIRDRLYDIEELILNLSLDQKITFFKKATDKL